MNSNSILNYTKRCLTCASQFTRFYATKDVTPGFSSLGKGKKMVKGVGGATQKVILPVEKDAHRLVNYVCGTNLLKEGGEDIALKPDSEYPDWLWEIFIERVPTLEDQDINTFEYWLTVRRLARRRKNQLVSRQRVKP